jgi:formate/nitrite transporter FocA (FNT family)
MAAEPSPNEQEDRRKAEQEEAEQRSAPTPTVVYEAIMSEGEDELARPPGPLAWSGVAAGLSMGFSMITEGLLRRYLPEAEWTSLVAKLGYSMGFLVVVLGREQLFTENTLTVVLPLLSRRGEHTLGRVLRLWGIVLLANLVGALAVAWAASKTAVFDEPAKQAFRQIAMEGVGAPFGTVLLRGVFAGWMIALMVWLMPGADTARVWVIIFVTYVIALGNFAHVIAGSVDRLYLVWGGQISLGAYLAGFLVPALLGNIVGGVSLVAALNHVSAAREANRT